MSYHEPDGPYVYQPYGSVTHPERGDRLFGVGGVAPGTEIKGLAKSEAEAIVAALNGAGGWVSVSERLPEPGTPVLVATKSDPVRRQYLGSEGGIFCWMAPIDVDLAWRDALDNYDGDPTVTHWQPLPEPPEASDG